MHLFKMLRKAKLKALPQPLILKIVKKKKKKAFDITNQVLFKAGHTFFKISLHNRFSFLFFFVGVGRGTWI